MIKEENKYLQTKYLEEFKYIDTQARNVFSKGCSPAMLKCAYGCNMYGCQDVRINKNKINNYCPRCNQLETWEHVILCSTINDEKRSSAFMTLWSISAFF